MIFRPEQKNMGVTTARRVRVDLGQAQGPEDAQHHAEGCSEGVVAVQIRHAAQADPAASRLRGSTHAGAQEGN